ncbi:MAG: hypothetical protein QOG95_2042, partial [Mycobacterium sp.]|nr:hypothetical protein [Mycobacterium sp.]
MVLHAGEIIALCSATVMTAALVRSHSGHGAGAATLFLLVTTSLVGWQGWRLIAGRRSLNVAGLAVQSGILMVSIAVAVLNLAAGATGMVLACSVLVGWGRFAKADPLNCAPTQARPDASNVSPLPRSVEVVAPRSATQIGISGALLAVLTALVVLAALSMRGGIVFGLAILAAIFIPLERLCALH